MPHDSAAVAIRAHDTALIDTTARLIEFLRKLAMNRRQRVLDCREYPQHGGRVMWLADLPEQVAVATDATAGDILLSLDPVKSEPPPPLPEVLRGWLDPREPNDSAVEPVLQESGLVPRDVKSAYRRWLPHWHTWAEHDRLVRPARTWYRDLAATAELLSQQDDEYEFVLATGLLSWRAADASTVCNHVLTTPVRVAMDPRTGRVNVLVDPDAVTRFEDRDLLEDGGDVALNRVAGLRDALRDQPAEPLADHTKELLEDWSTRVFDVPVRYAYEWAPQAAVEPVPHLTFAPALVLRRRGRASLIRYYDEMLAALSGPDAAAPLGLAQLVTALEPAERMAWLEEQGALSGEILGSDPMFPLPANAEQTQIMTRLRDNNGVVVQGPPGTGKTHTIANLISGLLAQGQRVLVTSQKAQALRVLRDKLPREIANLCISMTDLARGGSTELESSVKEMSSRYAGYSAEAQQQLIATLRQRLDEQRTRVSDLEDRIRRLRASESHVHDEVAPGYRGTLSEIAARLRDQQPRCGWIPTPLPTEAADMPPLTEVDAGELIDLLRTQTSQRAARTRQTLVDPAILPSAGQIHQMVTAEAAAHGLARQTETALSRTLEDCPADLADALRAETDTAATALHLAGLADDPAGWNPHDWAVRAVQDGLAGREATLWGQVRAHAALAAEARRALGLAGLRDVRLPPAAYQPNGAAALLRPSLALRRHFATGGRLRKTFRPRVQTDAEGVLTEASVDGVPPTTVDLLDVVIAQLHARATCERALRGWALVDVTFPADLGIERLTAQLVDQATRIEHVVTFVTAANRVKRMLLAAGPRVPLNSVVEWHAFAGTLDAVRRRLDAEQATAALHAVTDDLARRAGQGIPPPELEDAVSAVRARDVAAYRQALDGLAAAHGELAAEHRCTELSERLRSAHPGLAAKLGDSYADPDWDPRLGAWRDAWAWAKAWTFFDQQRRPGLEQRLEADLADATDRTLRTTAGLAAAQAWQHCLSRTTAEQAQALRSYQLHMGKLGKGTGRYAARYRGLAREAMRTARDAVPAWVMPLDHVLETMPPVRDSFDVVIVDEASQAGLESLFLLWLAPRVIVVGDDKQCAPSAVALGELEPIFTGLRTYLPDLPGHVRDVFTPNSSLFDILQARFGHVIRLREHFRCMPEIIGYSSHHFYGDEPLVPLRQFGSDRLPPLRHHRVADAYTEGTGPMLRNPREAEALVTRIQECLDDPAYRDNTFGVVVLQGTGQIDLIRSLLAERIDPLVRERRKLRVGKAADFQGDERDIVFLSLVVAEPRRAITDLRTQRIFNVAASRARDQMLLFHSVGPEVLSSIDLRHSLLSYVLNPPPSLPVEDLADVAADRPHAAFDSLFAQQVFLRIAERGYRMIPRFEVNGRRIDLVVVGANGRLAVECDGDTRRDGAGLAADLERERQLKRAGWRFWRVRGSEFAFDPDAAIADLWETLDRLGIDPGHRLAVSPTGAASTPALRSVPGGSPSIRRAR